MLKITAELWEQLKSSTLAATPHMSRTQSGSKNTTLSSQEFGNRSNAHALLPECVGPCAARHSGRACRQRRNATKTHPWRGQPEAQMSGTASA